MAIGALVLVFNLVFIAYCVCAGSVAFRAPVARSEVKREAEGIALRFESEPFPPPQMVILANAIVIGGFLVIAAVPGSFWGVFPVCAAAVVGLALLTFVLGRKELAIGENITLRYYGSRTSIPRSSVEKIAWRVGRDLFRQRIDVVSPAGTISINPLAFQPTLRAGLVNALRDAVPPECQEGYETFAACHLRLLAGPDARKLRELRRWNVLLVAAIWLFGSAAVSSYTAAKMWARNAPRHDIFLFCCAGGGVLIILMIVQRYRMSARLRAAAASSPVVS